MRISAGLDSEPGVPAAPGRNAEVAGPPRKDLNLPFWRRAGAEARAAGLERAANPFLRLVSSGLAGRQSFAVSSACSAAWLEGWRASDECAPRPRCYRGADPTQAHPSFP
jgi:hypothetical protein